MADSKTFVVNAPAWVDLSSKDAAASRDFYSKLFGWKVEEAPTRRLAVTRSPRSGARTLPASVRSRTPKRPRPG